MSDDHSQNATSPPRRLTTRRLILMLIATGVAVVAVIILTAWLIQEARDASLLAEDRLHFAMIGLVLTQCSQARGRLPYAVVTQQTTWESAEASKRKGTDRPLYSWRFEIWPYLQGWKGPWDSSQSWDHPINKPLVVAFSSFYTYHGTWRADDRNSFPETNVVAITGPGTAFGDGTAPPATLKNISPNTILAVETRASGIPWPAPGDLDIRTMPQTINAPDGKGISGRTARGFHVIFADGQLWFLSDKVPFETLRPFFTTADAEKSDREKWLGPYVLHRGI